MILIGTLSSSIARIDVVSLVDSGLPCYKRMTELSDDITNDMFFATPASFFNASRFIIKMSSWTLLMTLLVVAALSLCFISDLACIVPVWPTSPKG